MKLKTRHVLIGFVLVFILLNAFFYFISKEELETISYVDEDIIETESLDNYIIVEKEIEDKKVSLDKKLDIGEGKLYVLNTAGRDISVVDLEKGREVERIDVGLHPQSAFLSKDKLYVSVTDEDAVKVIDTRFNNVIDSITVEKPYDILIINNRLYVTNSNKNMLTVVNLDTREEKIIPTGIFPYMIVKHPRKDEIYVSNPNSNEISIIDTKINALKSNVKVDDEPEGIAVDNSGRFFFVANRAANKVTIYDTKTFSLREVHEGRYPIRITFSPNGKLAYASNYDGNSITKISANSLNFVNNIELTKEPFDILFSKDGRFMYVSHPKSNVISVLDALNEEFLIEIRVGKGPEKIILS